jgi:1-acyl-sn-glycerol-3-phosphate acyltransferase
MNETRGGTEGKSESPVGREPLLNAITTFLSDQDPRMLDEIRESLAREVDAAGPVALASLCERLATVGAEWQYYPPHPLAGRIHEVLADKLLTPDSVLHGVERLKAIAHAPIVLVSNHLSYSDANLLEILFRRAGAPELSSRLSVVAGPKVYSSLKRRFSSLCFGTVKTPQNSGVSSGDAVMNTREVARAARRSIEIALERIRLGEVLLVFAEGTRSRVGSMQRTLPGVTRYLENPGTRIVPVGILGTETLFPVGEDTFRPVRIEAYVGQPLDADVLRARANDNRRLMMDCIGLAIAHLLPREYRGVYDHDSPNLEKARDLYRELSA